MIINLNLSDVCYGALNEGNESTIPEHDRQPCEVWTRVMGYHRPTGSFNIGKKGEFAERKYFNEHAVKTN